MHGPPVRMAVLPVSTAFVALFDWGMGPFSFYLVSCRDYY